MLICVVLETKNVIYHYFFFTIIIYLSTFSSIECDPFAVLDFSEMILLEYPGQGYNLWSPLQSRTFNPSSLATVLSGCSVTADVR